MIVSKNQLLAPEKALRAIKRAHAEIAGGQIERAEKDLDKLTRKGILEFEPGRYVRDPKAIYKLKKRPTNDVSPNGNG